MLLGCFARFFRLFVVVVCGGGVVGRGVVVLLLSVYCLLYTSHMSYVSHCLAAHILDKTISLNIVTLFKI